MQRHYHIKLAFLLLAMIWFCSATFAQDFRSKSKKNRRQKDSSQVSNVEISSRTIYGIVKSKKNKETLPLANIFQLGTTHATQSDEYGAYTLKIDLKASGKMD